MLLDEAIKQIRDKKLCFEISIEGKKPFGVQTIERAEAVAGSLEKYFTNALSANNVKSLLVNTYKPNGSSYKRDGFFLVETPAVVSSATTLIETKNKDNAMNSIKAEIENATLHTEVKYLKQANETFADRNKELTRKNDELYNENSKLIRENAHQKQSLELEFRGKEMDLEKGKSSGLSGVIKEAVETLKDIDGDTAKLIAGFFPKHPMNNVLNGGTGNQIAEGKGLYDKHTDPDAQVCVEMVIPLMAKQTPEKLGMLALVVENLCNNEKNLNAVYEKIKPKDPPKTDPV
jgi:hypothetical protein